MHRVHSHNGLTYYRFQNLADSITHGIFTRQGGHSLPPFSSLNVGHTVGDDPKAVDANQRLICQALGIDPSAVVSARQVHGENIATVSQADKGKIIPATDALLTGDPGVPMMLRFADCVPILLCEPIRKVAAIIHAGRQGTLAGIAIKAVGRMIHQFGVDPGRVIAGIGPSIGPCCYQVGKEVVERLRFSEDRWTKFVARRGDGVFLDLWELNRSQLFSAGVRNIETAGLCTACYVEEFFSHRRERGRTGRFGALIQL